ncbi:MAG: MCE family protein [Nocardioides sp.]|nr:MCE family protein [Nocardioides sp.]
MTRLPHRLVAAVVAATLVAAALVVWTNRAQAEPLTVTADFSDTTGLYVGNDVEFLGVPVGEITSIEPRGTTMRVHMELAPGTELPADAGAVVLQSALVTDRYVELGPAYTGGAVLADGAHIDDAHTRSPATIDEVTESIDELVRALDGTARGGKDVGDLLAVGADALDGNGRRIRDALVSGERALRTVNDKGEDIRAVTANLAQLARALRRRDSTIRRFATSVSLSTHVVATQRRSLRQTLTSLAELSTLTTGFVRRNRDVIQGDLEGALAVAEVVRRRQDQLAEAFDTMPTLAQNLTQAYDFDLGRLRVQFSTKVGPFSRVFRAELCDQVLRVPLCHALFQADGSGLLDPVLDGILDQLPGNFP